MLWFAIYFFLSSYQLHVKSQTISNVKFLENSSLFSDGRDGIVVVKLDTGEETTICNYKFTEIEAGIVCKSLGFTANGFSIINHKQYKMGKVLIGNVNCSGEEPHLKFCVHSGRKEFSGLCGEHQMDVHVYCVDSKLPINNSHLETTCKTNSEMSLQTLPGKINTGFLQVKLNGKMNYICNDDFNFGLESAQCFCNKMCTNTNYPRPIMFLEKTGLTINENSSYVKTVCSGCSCHSSPLSTCDPSYVVGLRCGDEPVITEKSPAVACNHEKMTIIWTNDTVPFINSTLVSLFPDCKNSSLYDDSDGNVILSLRLGDCNPLIKDENEHVLYSYNIHRQYMPVGVTLQNPTNMVAQCKVIKQNQITNKMEFRKVTAAWLQFKRKLSTRIGLFTDGSFARPLAKVNDVVFGKPMFVKIYIEHPPKDVKLSLYDCSVSSDDKFTNSKVVNLIQNICPNESFDVQITYLNRYSIGFQFKPFNFVGNQNMPIYIRCSVIYCYVPNDRHCRVCKSHSKVKRSIVNYGRKAEIIGPIRIF